MNFIEKSCLVHNNFYDYSKVEYKNIMTKVIIICPKHGELKKIPNDHLKGSGCKQCGIEKRSSKRRLTKDEIENMVNDAEKYKVEDEKIKK